MKMQYLKTICQLSKLLKINSSELYSLSNLDIMDLNSSFILEYMISSSTRLTPKVIVNTDFDKFYD